MTNAELIDKIKAEINYRIETYIGNAQSCVGTTLVDGLEEVLDLLSTLESENPMNMDEELNEEIKKEMVKLPFFIRGKDQIAFARHFAKWGAEHANK